MPELEFSEDGSNKFWKIELDGSSFTARWGKIGTRGQEKRQDFDSAEEARREYAKLIASKLKKGYREVGAAPKAADIPSYLVLADSLQSQGDPRGELISIQHARLTADTPALAAREAQLLEGQSDVLFGDLAPHLKTGGLTVGWHLGFLRKVRLAREGYRGTLDVGEALQKLLEMPIASALEELASGLCDDPGDGDFQAAIDVLVETRKPATLRTLFLGDFKFPDDSDISSTGVGDTSKLYAAFPELRSLKLRGASAELGKISLPELREFTFETGALTQESLEAVATAKWPKLERLTIWSGDENYGADCSLEDFKPILAGKGLPALRHLGIVDSGLISGNIDALAKAKILPQLHSLDLSLGTLRDDDAEAFLRHAAAFQHLQQLDVSHDYLSDRGLFLLRKVVKEVVSTAQQDAGLADDRYVSVGE